MKYQKPELTPMGPALLGIQNPQAKPGYLTFDSSTIMPNDLGTVNAYEADE
jgi:hypothetical protein